MSKQTTTLYRSMTTEQRVKYNAEFMKWYANRNQITDCVAQHNSLDAEANSAFDEGVRLLQAWPFGVKFLDSVNCLPKARCVSRLMYLADLTKRNLVKSSEELGVRSEEYSRRDNAKSQQSNDNDSQSKQSEKESQTGAAEQTTPHSSAFCEAKALTPNSNEVLPVGKLHLDQISYLLSPTLADRVKNLKQILDTRDAESNIAKQLAADGKSQQEIAPHSEAAVKAQEEATDIFERVDDELAEYVAADRYIRTRKPEPGQQETAFKATLSNLEEAAKPFGSLDRMIAALTPYYEKCNKDGRIDRIVEHDFKVYENKVSANGASDTDNSSLFEPSAKASSSRQEHKNALSNGCEDLTPHSSLESEAPAYDQKEYKRIWTYVSRQDVAHTEKRLQKMRECIDQAIAAKMPNIEAMETFYAKEAELVLAEQQKRLNNDQEPSLL